MFIEGAKGFSVDPAAQKRHRHPVTVWRERRGLTKAELAERIDAPEIIVEMFEGGGVRIPGDAVVALSRALGIKASDLAV